MYTPVLFHVNYLTARMSHQLSFQAGNVRYGEVGGASRESVNIGEFKSPTQLSIIPDPCVDWVICWFNFC